MTTPVRLRLSRAKGADLQAASRAINGLPAKIVTRPGPFGNPAICTPENCTRRGHPEARRCCLDVFEKWLETGDGHISGIILPDWNGEARDRTLALLPELRGHNLACWCEIDQPCHADALLRLANLEARGL